MPKEKEKMANYCSNMLYVLARESEMRSILLKMAENLSAAGGKIVVGLNNSNPTPEIINRLREELYETGYLYALTASPEHRHMSNFATLEVFSYAGDWWRMGFYFATDWGPADTELSQFYCSIEDLDFGWFTGFRVERERPVFPYASVEIDEQYKGYSTMEDRFFASHYHWATGEVPPPDKYYVTHLLRTGGMETLRKTAEKWDVDELVEKVNPKDLYEREQYEAFAYVLKRRKTPWRPRHPETYLISSVQRGDEQTVQAIVEHISWKPCDLDSARDEMATRLEEGLMPVALDAISHAEETMKNRELEKRKKRKPQAADISAEDAEVLLEPSVDYSETLERSRWDGEEPLVSVRVREDVDDRGFKGCATLTRLYFDRCSLGEEAFSNCACLVSVLQAGGTVVNLKSRAFSGCTSLKRLELKVGTDDEAMLTGLVDGCVCLVYLRLSGNLRLTKDALGSAPRLQYLTLMGGLVIFPDTFNGCTALRSIRVGVNVRCEGAALAELPKDCVIECQRETELINHARELGLDVRVGKTYGKPL